MIHEPDQVVGSVIAENADHVRHEVTCPVCGAYGLTRPQPTGPAAYKPTRPEGCEGHHGIPPTVGRTFVDVEHAVAIIRTVRDRRTDNT